MRIPLFHVDAFASRPFSGNPAGICLLDSWLDDVTLLKVAGEINLPATAFLVEKAGKYEIRWFTPVRELTLCGHATLAAAFVILNVRQNSRNNLELETRHSGTLVVQKTGDFLRMDFPALFSTSRPDPPKQLKTALGLDSDPDAILEVGERYIVILGSARAVANLRPGFSQLAQLHPFVVGVTAKGQQEDFVSRYFTPSYGTNEDQVTGSLHCALAPYWAKQLGKSELHARQLSERGGELWCETSRDRVILKGQAVLTMQGSMTI
jgi:PhzF family phenazine biosynthesis protein